MSTSYAHYDNPHNQHNRFEQQRNDFYQQANPEESSLGQGSLLKQARRGFVRKVFSILAAQLTFTAFLIYLSQYNKSFRTFQMQNDGLLTLFTVATIACVLLMHCVDSITKKVPLNYIVLSIFTFSEAYTVSAYTIFFSKVVVLKAGLLVAGATLLLVAYAATTKKDITIFNSLIFILLSGLFLTSILNWFIRSDFVVMLIELASVILYSLYLIYDVQLVMGNSKLSLNLDNYILGSIFIKVLKFLQKLEEKKEKKERK